MRSMRLLALLTLFTLLIADVSLAVPPPARQSAPPAEREPAGLRVPAGYGTLPMAFEENRGQTDAGVKFLTRGAGYTAFVTGTETVLALQPPRAARRPGDPAMAPAARPSEPAARVTMKMAGANPTPRVSGVERLPGIANYFIGKDPVKWRTNIPTYARVEVGDVYPGVGMVYYGHGRQLEYDLVVAPGADPLQIRVAFEGAERIGLDAAGDLVLGVGGRELRMRKPVVYQAYGRTRRTIDARYTLKTAEGGATQVTFALGAWDRRRPLVIDPVLVYTTYLGGSSVDDVNAIAADAAGNAYVAGDTSSPNFPLAGALGTDAPFTDAFVSKLNPAGTALVYSTYLGGQFSDFATAVAVDAAGNAYVAGSTEGWDFPTTVGAFQTDNPGDFTAFVTKLNPAGSALVYSTFLGGSNQNHATGIAVNAAGNAHVVGFTSSADFPVFNAAFGIYSTNILSLPDAFVAKLTPDGSDLVYSTYLGGFGTTLSTGSDAATGVALDATGNAWVVGTTTSTDFPLVNPTKSSLASGGQNAFVSKLDPTGAVLFSTYFGGSTSTVANAVAVDPAGSVYIAGATSDTDLPVLHAYQPMIGGIQDAFVAKLSPTGTLVYSTYLGGSANDSALGIAVGPSGSAWVGGFTDSNFFPVTTPPVSVVFEAGFIARLDPTGSTLSFSTLLEAGGQTNVRGVALDPSGRLYLGGFTAANNFTTTTGVAQPMTGGGTDGFVSVYRTLPDLVVPSVAISAATATPGARLTATFSVKNQGDTVAGASLARFFLGAPGGGGPLALIGQFSVPTLAAGASASATALAFTVPKPTPAGNYVVVACADDRHQVAEEDETNNCASSATLVLQRPDLVVQTVSSTAMSVAHGASVAVSTTVRNQGNAPSLASMLRYYLALGTTRQASDVRSTTTTAVPMLAAAALMTFSNVAVAVPATLTPGTYRVIACADDKGVVGESNESNNCLATGTVSVTAPARARR